MDEGRRHLSRSMQWTAECDRNFVCYPFPHGIPYHCPRQWGQVLLNILVLISHQRRFFFPSLRWFFSFHGLLILRKQIIQWSKHSMPNRQTHIHTNNHKYNLFVYSRNGKKQNPWFDSLGSKCSWMRIQLGHEFKWIRSEHDNNKKMVQL